MNKSLRMSVNGYLIEHGLGEEFSDEHIYPYLLSAGIDFSEITSQKLNEEIQIAIDCIRVEGKDSAEERAALEGVIDRFRPLNQRKTKLAKMLEYIREEEESQGTKLYEWLEDDIVSTYEEIEKMLGVGEDEEIRELILKIAEVEKEKTGPRSITDVVGISHLRDMVDFFANLYYRWQDEHEYEDFAEYKKALAKRSGFSIKRFSKSPFKAIFEVSGCTGQMEFKNNKVELAQLV